MNLPEPIKKLILKNTHDKESREEIEQFISNHFKELNRLMNDYEKEEMRQFVFDAMEGDWKSC